MHKLVHAASAGCLTILASLFALPSRSQVPSPPSTTSPQPTTSPQSTTSPQPTTSPQATPDSPVGGNIIGKFSCGTKDTATGEIWLRANGYYTLNSENGKYQTIDRGYRFLSSSLRGQSMIRYKNGMYLIDSKDEAKAASIISNDSSPTNCTGVGRQ